MKSDFSRISFDPDHPRDAVLFQQGRVQTDADHNEAHAIHAHELRSLAASLTGTEGAIWYSPQTMPVQTRHLPGFWIATLAELAELLKTIESKEVKDAISKHPLWISPGHYYVDGLRCENDAWIPLDAQPQLPAKAGDPLAQPDTANPSRLRHVYLDAWQRAISWLDDSRLRDIALGAEVDTAMRNQLVWQVKAIDVEARAKPWQRKYPLLRVRVDPGKATTDPCRPAFASKWHGQENQLYRVEIHSVFQAEHKKQAPEAALIPPRDRGDAENKKSSVTFKWSRENGSVAALVKEANGDVLRVSPRLLKAGGFQPGNWVEIINEDIELLELPGTMRKVKQVRGDTIILEPHDPKLDPPDVTAITPKPGDKLRRWDQVSCKTGLLEVTEVADHWVDLEAGIQVCFCSDHLPDGDASKPQAASLDSRPDFTAFRSGDYWVFTARTALGDVEWPDERASEPRLGGMPVRLTKELPAALAPRVPKALPPHGVRHHYALLATAAWGKDGWNIDDVRRIFSMCLLGKRAVATSPPGQPDGMTDAPLRPPAGFIPGLVINPRPSKDVVKQPAGMMPGLIEGIETPPARTSRVIESAADSAGKPVKKSAAKLAKPVVEQPAPSEPKPAAKKPK